MTRFLEQYEATRKAFGAACESTRKASAELAALVSLGVPMPIVGGRFRPDWLSKSETTDAICAMTPWYPEAARVGLRSL